MSPNPWMTEVACAKRTLVLEGREIVTLGSCFADEIGTRLADAGFRIQVNPFGTLFHPLGLWELLDRGADLSPALACEIEGRAHHFRLPKTFYANDQDELRSEWRRRKERLWASLESGAVLLITLGTSYLYERTVDGLWVNNCLQRPRAEFRKRLSSLAEMESGWQRIASQLPKDLSVLVTVSPVRHLKDGLSENSLSKSQLRVLAETMVRSDPERIQYFPAYEILLDELRDYRFYADDMLHPSPAAVRAIYERFQGAYCDDGSRRRIAAWERLQARMGHRPLHPDSESHRAFQEALRRDMEAWETSLPGQKQT